MKIIKYKFLSCEVNHGTKKNPNIEQIFLNKSIPWSETNEEIAKAEAYTGLYEIIDNDQSDFSETPAQLDAPRSKTYLSRNHNSFQWGGITL